MSATNYVVILPKDPKYELPNDSQIAFLSYAGKFSRRRQRHRLPKLWSVREDGYRSDGCRNRSWSKRSKQDVLLLHMRIWHVWKGNILFLHRKLKAESIFYNFVFIDWHMKCTSSYDPSPVLPEWSLEWLEAVEGFPRTPCSKIQGRSERLLNCWNMNELWIKWNKNVHTFEL